MGLMYSSWGIKKVKFRDKYQKYLKGTTKRVHLYGFGRWSATTISEYDLVLENMYFEKKSKFRKILHFLGIWNISYEDYAYGKRFWRLQKLKNSGYIERRNQKRLEEMTTRIQNAEWFKNS